jgi:hypothetical protein
MTTSSDKTSPPASTTIGYSYLLAKSGVTHAIVMAEVFSGLLFVAVFNQTSFAP